LEGIEFKKDEPIGHDPVTGLPIFVLNGRFGPYVQLGVKPPKEKKKTAKKLKKVKGETSPTAVPAAPETIPAEAVVHKPIKPKMASIPKTMDPSKVAVADALKYLSLPRTLGTDPATGKEVVASAGRFGPFVVRDGDFRSIKVPDNVYDITLERALEMLAVPKKIGRGRFAKKKT
jgi:DNA topoisomerase-1